MRFHQGVFVVALLLVAAQPVEAVPPDVDRGLVPTGILYDLVTPIAHIDRFDGSVSAPSANAATLRQAVFELTRASLTPPGWPDAGSFRDDGGLVIRIGLIDVAYDRVRDGAAVRVEGDRLILDDAAVEAARAFLAAPMRAYTYRGDVSFVLDPRLFVGEHGAPAPNVEIDFGDGNGYQRAPWNVRIDVHYAAARAYVVRVRASGVGGELLHADFFFDVRALATPTPNDTIPLTGTQPYNGGTATGRAFVYLSNANATLTKPVVVVEGFDIDNTMDWDELYALLNQQGLVEELRTRGYDAVVLDFTEATDYIQRNAFVLVDLLHQVQAAIGAQVDFPLVGASMGGLVARYALAWMENNADPHRVRNFISFDAPHAGANIPLGIQYWLDFFADQAAEAAFLLSRLDTPGARQMLIYHHTTPPGATGEPDPLRGVLASELAGLGEYPTALRKVALSNGSGVGTNQGFAAGAQIIRYEYNSILVTVRGNVWAVPNGGPTQILQALIDPIFLPPDAMNVTVSGTLPWDNAPGGSRNSMAQMDSVVAPYGDIVALHQRHCFIPTVSALDIATTDPFYDIAGDPDLLAHTPFDNLYVAAANDPHITVTPENALWLLEEVDPAPSGVRPGTSSPPSLSVIAAAPNPFNDATTIRWELSRSARLRAEVFDVRGARVATLLDAARPSGAGEVRWSGRDDGGRTVAAGVYFVRVQALGKMQTRRVVLVR